MEGMAEQVERPYEFRRRLAVVHQPDRRDPAARPANGEVAIGAGWASVVSRQTTPLVLGVAQDRQHYLLVSMGESVLLRRVDDVAAAARDGRQVIVLATPAELGDFGAALTAPQLAGLVTLPLGLAIPAAPAAVRQLGHSGAEWFLVRDFLASLRAGTPPPLDVYDAVMMTLPGVGAPGRRAGRRAAIPAATSGTHRRCGARLTPCACASRSSAW